MLFLTLKPTATPLLYLLRCDSNLSGDYYTLLRTTN